MRSLAFVFCFVVGAGAMALLLPFQHRLQLPPLKPDKPLQAAMQRYQARLNADGTLPDNALMKAKHQRDMMVSQAGQQRAGVSPAVWQYVGPNNIGGRIRAIVCHPTNTNILWVGTASGGIWKTTDGGTTWFPLDDFMASLAVGCMALHPSQPDVLYAGTGEGFFETVEGSGNTAAVRGAGIFKSTNGGTTWIQIPTTANPDFYMVNRIAMHPTDPNTMLVATSTGLFRTNDAGNSWNKVSNEYVYDVDFHPTDGSKAVMGVHENGVFFSTDGGLTWTHSPSIAGHRTELDYARSSPSILYASVSEADLNRIWRSTDGGATWTIAAGAGISCYSAYNNALWVSPSNANNLMFGGVYLYRSTNSGASNARCFNNIHADAHVFATHPQYNGGTNKIVYVGTDGGIFRINDWTGTATNFTFISNSLGATQFYGAAINPISGRIMGGTQDNYTLLYSGNPNNWTVSAGGDGGYAATDYTDANYFYGCIYWALQFRSTNGGTSTSYIYNTANPITDANDDTMVNFINHHILDPNDPNRYYVATARLWRSSNVKAASPAWFIIKPELPLPRNPNGGNAHFAGNPPRNISTIAVAKGNSNVIWVGHNNGQVYKSTDGMNTNPTWTRMDTNGPLPGRWVSKIWIHPTDSNRVYVSYFGWSPDNVWRTLDGGLTWQDISGNLPDAPTSCIAGHPTMTGWLYAGTDIGLFTSTDDGATWSPLTQGPGTVPVEEINWKNNNTVMAVTHGRGVWLATVNAPEQTFVADSFAALVGKRLSGKLEDTWSSNDSRMKLGTNVRFHPGATSVLELTGTSSVSNPSTIKFTFESRSTNEVFPIGVELYNHVSGLWEELARPTVTASDAVNQVSVTTAASRFVGPGGSVKARLNVYIQSKRATVEYDNAYWSVTP